MSFYMWIMSFLKREFTLCGAGNFSLIIGGKYRGKNREKTLKLSGLLKGSLGPYGVNCSQ